MGRRSGSASLQAQSPAGEKERHEVRDDRGESRFALQPDAGRSVQAWAADLALPVCRRSPLQGKRTGTKCATIGGSHSLPCAQTREDHSKHGPQIWLCQSAGAVPCRGKGSDTKCATIGGYFCLPPHRYKGLKLPAAHAQHQRVSAQLLRVKLLIGLVLLGKVLCDPLNALNKRRCQSAAD